MLIVVRPASHLPLALAVAAAVLAAACTPAAPPVAEKKPRRRSFEESSAYRAPAPAAPQSGTASTDAQAKQVQQTWDQARQATSDAERERLAGEALKQSRAMAEPQPSGHQ
jgi:YD repeat-containing protein